MSTMTPTLPTSHKVHTPRGETRIVVRSVPWSTYELWIDSLPAHSGVRMAFDGEDLEIMTKGPTHEDFRDLLGQLVREICMELGIPHKCLGETTWKRPDLSRGIEADQCYFFRPEKLAAVAAARSRGSNDVADYPNPDLAIEIDISPSLIDRAAIYAALGVTEIWRFDGEVLAIDRLNPEGYYCPAQSSVWLPIRPEEVVRWLTREDSTDDLAWTGRLRNWVRTELTNRPSGT